MGRMRQKYTECNFLLLMDPFLLGLYLLFSLIRTTVHKSTPRSTLIIHPLLKEVAMPTTRGKGIPRIPHSTCFLLNLLLLYCPKLTQTLEKKLHISVFLKHPTLSPFLRRRIKSYESICADVQCFHMMADPTYLCLQLDIRSF